MDPEKGPWLFGYAIKGVKSLRGDELVRVGPLGKMNFLVGRNNHGKSTVMRAAAQWAGKRSQADPTVETATLVPVPTSALRRVERSSPAPLAQLLEQGTVVEIDAEHTGLWMDGTHIKTDRNMARQLAQKTMQTQHAISLNDDAPPGPSRSVIIPAFRELRPAPTTQGSDGKVSPPKLPAGEGLVAELGTWFAPPSAGSPSYHAARRRWTRLQEFMRVVLEDPDADLEVASNQEDLHVQLSQAGEMLHIDVLGDGVKQVLMIAAACILYEDHLVLLEEPEIHLHAGLQRKLMRFLADNTENQYLVATHSAHMLDLPGAQIFHVTHDGSATTVAPAVRASEVQRVCQDLGYMASDLLQANYTIWVEGPSDRIYWRRWLELVDPDLVEGVHFTVMVYGGYLIDGVHIQADPDDETAAEDLIQLLHLGRECTVIADSDKKGSDDPARPTLERLTEEAEKPGSGQLVVCEWASTVENLLPRELFRNTVIEAHPTAGKRLATDTHHAYANPFAGMRKGTYSKVDIARRVAAQLTAEHLDDELEPVVDDLALRIRTANGI